MPIYRIRATLYFLRTDEGGKTVSPSIGYRAQLRTNAFLDQAFQLSSAVGSGNYDHLELGKEYEVELWYITPNPELKDGSEFQIREGERVVARGRVLEMLEYLK